MMAKGAFENLTKWQNYAHYILLAIVLTIFMHFQGVHIFHTENFFPNMNFVWLFVVLFVADTLIHWIFYNLPKPFRWRD